VAPEKKKGKAEEEAAPLRKGGPLRTETESKCGSPGGARGPINRTEGGVMSYVRHWKKITHTTTTQNQKKGKEKKQYRENGKKLRKKK